MKSFTFDPGTIVVGSALRRAVGHLLAERELRFEPRCSAKLNDLIFGEIIQAPTRPFAKLKYNFLERLYACDGAVRLKNELLQPGPCVGVVGNRYAPPYLIGGLTNPITGQLNGEIQGGAIVDGLFGVNAIGFVNREADPGERVRIQVHGVIVNRTGRPVNLSSFRELIPDAPPSLTPEPRVIMVTGYATNSGKTMCARALVAELRSRGFEVTVEKKTGTACCRDWLRCYADPGRTALENEGDEIVFTPDDFPARDFVDGLGVASDVSVPIGRFVSASIKYSQSFLAKTRPDFHVLELADNISHPTNERLLRSQYFRKRVTTLIYSPLPTFEAVTHFQTYLWSLGYGRTPALLSGPLANEVQYAMARDEIEARLGLPICRSAVNETGLWIPEGKELVNAVLATVH
jgi:hypothetical protein